MELLTLPQLRLAQLQSATERILEITEPLTAVSEQHLKVNAAFADFQKGMTKDIGNSEKKTLDRTRDKYNSGFFKSVEAEQEYPHDEAVKLLVKDLVRISDKYGYSINWLPYDEETAQIDNMVSELEALDLTPLPAVGRWTALLKDANTAFKATSAAYLQEITTASNTSSATLAAKPLEDALSQLFTLIFAHANVSGTEELIQAYQKIGTLLDSYR